MPRSQTMGEAILRELGGVAQDVGGQIQATQDFNQELARKTGIDERDFEALQLQRSIQNQLAQGRELRAQQQFDIDNPMGPPAPAAPERFKTVGALEASILQDAFEQGGIEGFATTQRHLKAAGRAPSKVKAPRPSVTPLQRSAETQKVFEGQRQESLDEGGYLSLQDLRERSAAGLAGKESFWGDTPPDSTAHRDLRAYLDIGGPEHAQAFRGGDSLSFYRPEIPGGQQPTLDSLLGAQQQDPDAMGRAKYEDWDTLSPEQKQRLINAGFPD